MVSTKMSVFLSNLDDFIAPGQACVNPFVASRSISPETVLKSTNKSKIIQLSDDISTTEYETILKPDLIKTKQS
jgi:hypothetical protein